MVVDDDAAVAIENFSTWGEEGNGFDAIAVGEFAVELAVADLQHPEASDEEQENDYAQILKNGDAAQRETGVVLEQTAGRHVLGLAAFGFDGAHEN
jgi:hypothetical protein